MKFRTLMWIAAMTLFAALAIPLRLAAQHTNTNSSTLVRSAVPRLVGPL
jgi:hypothetical protein